MPQSHDKLITQTDYELLKIKFTQPNKVSLHWKMRFWGLRVINLSLSVWDKLVAYSRGSNTEQENLSEDLGIKFTPKNETDNAMYDLICYADGEIIWLNRDEIETINIWLQMVINIPVED